MSCQVWLTLLSVIDRVKAAAPLDARRRALRHLDLALLESPGLARAELAYCAGELDELMKLTGSGEAAAAELRLQDFRAWLATRAALAMLEPRRSA